MPLTERHCPGCQTPLELVQLSDLIEERKGQMSDTLVSTLSFIFDCFDCYVCAACGFTQIHASPEVKRIAREKGDEIIGIS